MLFKLTTHVRERYSYCATGWVKAAGPVRPATHTSLHLPVWPSHRSSRVISFRMCFSWTTRDTKLQQSLRIGDCGTVTFAQFKKSGTLPCLESVQTGDGVIKENDCINYSRWETRRPTSALQLNVALWHRRLKMAVRALSSSAVVETCADTADSVSFPWCQSCASIG